MLVLSRKCGERIVLPDQGVEVTVLAVQGDRVRLGIMAPPAVAVHRQEVWEQIREFQENEPGQPTIDPAEAPFP